MKAKNLFFPFERIAGLKSLIIGASTVFGAGMVGYYTNTRFDGILNIHSAMGQAKWLYVLEPVVSILVVSIWFILLCKIFSKKSFRIIDVVGTQYFSFLPIAPLAFLGCIKTFDKLAVEAQILMNDHSYTMDLSAMDIGIVVVVMVLVMSLVMWSGWLMYSALQVSANLKHKLAIPIFISGLVVGNIIPRLIF